MYGCAIKAHKVFYSCVYQNTFIADKVEIAYDEGSAEQFDSRQFQKRISPNLGALSCGKR